MSHRPAKQSTSTSSITDRYSLQILSHGRCHSAKMMGTMASGILGELDRLQKEGGREKVRDVIVVALVSTDRCVSNWYESSV